MSLINVQAGVALHLVDRRPEQAQTALMAIKDASKEALVELRALVGVLRDETEAAPRVTGVDARLARRPGRAQRATPASPCARSSRATYGRLPASVELAAFRIVQEAITNVVRHSGARHADVRLDYGADVLSVRIDDDGSGAAARAASLEPGSGLRGMRERAVALGGTLTVGAAPAGGVRVEAVLPLRWRPVIRVVLADDQALLRAGLRALLDAEDDIEVVGEAANGREADQPSCARPGPTSC